MESVYAHNLDFRDELEEPVVEASLNGFVTIRVGGKEAVLLGSDWLSLIQFATKKANLATASESDPYRFLHKGEEDPIGPFDPENTCGATHEPGEHGVIFQCLRVPHREDWVHVDASDGVVDAVWMNID